MTVLGTLRAFAALQHFRQLLGVQWKRPPGRPDGECLPNSDKVAALLQLMARGHTWIGVVIIRRLMPVHRPLCRHRAETRPTMIADGAAITSEQRLGCVRFTLRSVDIAGR
jgi:hypothetical protein